MGKFKELAIEMHEELGDNLTDEEIAKWLNQRIKEMQQSDKQEYSQPSSDSKK